MSHPTKGKGKAARWISDHRDYPHDYCLIWPFARESRVGRGMMGKLREGGSQWAHRIMCEAAHGPAPEGRPQAAHSCGNGHKGCVNPRHLAWKSNSENQLDRTRHGRTLAAGWKKKFTPEKIDELRSLRSSMTQMALADRFDCSLGTVQYYLKYRDQKLKRPLGPYSNGDCEEVELPYKRGGLDGY